MKYAYQIDAFQSLFFATKDLDTVLASVHSITTMDTKASPSLQKINIVTFKDHMNKIDIWWLPISAVLN